MRGDIGGKLERCRLWLDPWTDKTGVVPKQTEVSPRLEILRPNELLSGILLKKFNHYVGELTDIYYPYLSSESIKRIAKQTEIVVGLAVFTSILFGSGSYCKPHTGWLINDIISFLPVLWPESPTSRCYKVRFWWESSSVMVTARLALYPHVVESRDRKQVLSWLS